MCATLSGHLPTLFELSDPVPLASFASPAPPPPTTLTAADAPPSRPAAFPRGYRNTTTTKHSSFGGGRGAEPGRGLYYAAGSDDFGVYVWEVPRLEALREGRRDVGVDELVKGQVGASSWLALPPLHACSRARQLMLTMRAAFVRTMTPLPTDFDGRAPLPPPPVPDRLTLPALVSPAHATLTAHRSIVNTALFHPTLPVLYTSGVEKLVVRHEAHLPGLALARPRPGTTSASSSSSSARTWSYVPRAPKRKRTVAELLERADATLEPDSASSGGGGGGERARGEDAERRRRAEDTAVLEYFDGLVAEEADGEELWREGGYDDELSSDEEEELALREIEEERSAAEGGWGAAGEEQGEGESEEERERRGGEGPSGTTRRTLRAIYAAEEQELSGSSEDEGGGGETSSAAEDGVDEEE